MASAMQFKQPSLNWNASDTYQEFQRFKQHVKINFKSPLEKAVKANRAGWLGMWIEPQGREVFKTFTRVVDPDHPEISQQDDPDIILQKFENYVRPAKYIRAACLKNQQRHTQKKEGESFDNFV